MGAVQNGFQYSEEQISDRKIIRQRAEQNYTWSLQMLHVLSTWWREQGAAHQ
jgi:hypothetical protein